MNYAKYMMMEIKRIGTHARGKSGRVGWARPAGYVTNSEYAEQDARFNDACTKAGLPATKRQASKFRRGFGTSYRNR